MTPKRKKDMSFEKLASKYDSGIAGKGSKKFYNLLLNTLDVQPGAKVLDVGCGTGALLKMIAEISDISGFGIDAEEKMIATAIKNCPQMQFLTGTCDNLPFEDNSFDVLIACMAYHHFNNKEGFAREASRVLVTGGILYIVDPLFPWFIRKTMNGILRLIRITGEFFNPEEIEAFFTDMGFIGLGTIVDSYAQLVKLRRNA